jgi:parallel beta-helix repeat protein
MWRIVFIIVFILIWTDFPTVNAAEIEKEEWTIKGEESVDGVTMELKGNLSVKAKGKLYISNSLIKMHGERIYVEDGGFLEIKDSIITAPHTFRFVVYGTLRLIRAEIGNLGGDFTTYPPRGGLELYTKDAYLLQTTLSGSVLHAVHLENADVRIERCTLTGNSKCGVWARESSVILEDNYIGMNGAEGVYLERSTATLQNNIITSNIGDGVKLVCSEATVKDNQLLNNKGWGVWQENSEVVWGDNVFPAGAENEKGKLWKGWWFAVNVVDGNGKPLKGTEILVVDDLNKLVIKTTTDVSGNIPYAALPERVWWNNDTTHTYKYSVQVLYENIETDTTFTLEQEKLQTVVIPPDLVARPITISGEMEKGSLIEIRATVFNKGKIGAADIYVDVYINNKSHGTAYIDFLEVGESQTVAWKWKAQAGEHKIEVFVDPQNNITETDELNNRLTKTIVVGAFWERVLVGGIVALVCVAIAVLVVVLKRKRRSVVVTKPPVKKELFYLKKERESQEKPMYVIWEKWIRNRPENYR